MIPTKPDNLSLQRFHGNTAARVDHPDISDEFGAITMLFIFGVIWGACTIYFINLNWSKLDFNWDLIGIIVPGLISCVLIAIAIIKSVKCYREQTHNVWYVSTEEGLEIREGEDIDIASVTYYPSNGYDVYFCTETCYRKNQYLEITEYEEYQVYIQREDGLDEKLLCKCDSREKAEKFRDYLQYILKNHYKA